MQPVGEPAIPFADPPWLNGIPSPYYLESHRRWQKACRAFVDEHLTQHALDWEREGAVPEEVFGIFAKANMLIPCLACPLPVEALAQLGIHDILGVVKTSEFDYLHTSIYWDEVRCLACRMSAVSSLICR